MRREELYLNDIVESTNAIERFLNNVTEEAFSSNELLQSAVSYKLKIIGEASAHISDRVKNLYPEIEWKEIIGFRNYAVHVYFAVNLKILWTTATDDIAILKKQILEVLEKEFPDFDSGDAN